MSEDNPIIQRLAVLERVVFQLELAVRELQEREFDPPEEATGAETGEGMKWCPKCDKVKIVEEFRHPRERTYPCCSECEDVYVLGEVEQGIEMQDGEGELTELGKLRVRSWHRYYYDKFVKHKR